MEKVLRKTEDSAQLVSQVDTLRRAAADAPQTAESRAENDPDIKRMPQLRGADMFNRAAQRFFDREVVNVWI